jgi:hypothetical protein
VSAPDTPDIPALLARIEASLARIEALEDVLLDTRERHGADGPCWCDRERVKHDSYCARLRSSPRRTRDDAGAASGSVGGYAVPTHQARPAPDVPGRMAHGMTLKPARSNSRMRLSRVCQKDRRLPQLAVGTRARSTPSGTSSK